MVIGWKSKKNINLNVTVSDIDNKAVVLSDGTVVNGIYITHQNSAFINVINFH